MWKKVRRMEPQIRRAKGFDIFVTHAPALGLGDGPDLFHEGFASFRYLVDIYRPDIHFYGHRHLGENPKDRRAIYPYQDTVMINACGYKLVDYDPGVPMSAPPAVEPIIEMPTPMPPRRFPFLF